MVNWKKGAFLLGLGLALVSPALILTHCVPRSEFSDHEALIAALSNSEGRFTGAPPPSKNRDRNHRIPTDALRRLQKNAVRNPSTDATIDMALMRVLGGKLDSAVGLFERASRDSPGDARALNDLAAGYIVRFAASSNSYDLIQALAATDRAIGVAPKLAEARFNQARSLQLLGLHNEAARSWKRYLQLDNETVWSEKARSYLTLGRPSRHKIWETARLNLLEYSAKGNYPAIKNLVARFPQNARLYCEEDVLGAWAEAKSRGIEAEAGKWLAIMKLVGRAIFEHNGDAMLLEITREIDEAQVAKRSRVDYLVNGYMAYQRGLKLAKADRFDVALDQFLIARGTLAAEENTLAYWAAVQAAVCYYYRQDYVNALSILNELLRDQRIHAFYSLRGRCAWMAGLIQFSLGHLPLALSLHVSALRIFSELHENEHAGYLNTLIATDLYHLGEFDRSWIHHYKALQYLADQDDPRRVYSTLCQAVELLLIRGSVEGALHLLTELILIDSQDQIPGIVVETFARRGYLQAKLNKYSEASRDLIHARQYVQRIADSNFRSRVNADLLVLEAQIRLPFNHQAAIRMLSEALSYYQSIGYDIDTAEVYRKRAAAYLVGGDLISAEVDLLAGIKLFERSRGQLNPEQRIVFFEQIQSIADMLVNLEAYSLNRPLLALQYAERVRALSLLEVLRDGERESFVGFVDSLRRALPNKTAILEYAVLSGRLAIWVIKPTGAKMFLREIDEPILQDMVNRHIRELGMAGIYRQTGGELFDVLVGPARKYLEGVESLVVVPDKFLHGFPFATLYDTSKSQFLIEARAVTAVPSSATYMEMLRISRLFLNKKPSSILIVVNNEFNRRSFATLSTLRSTRNEAQQIAKLYPSVTILEDIEISKTQLIKEMFRNEVIHIAGHAVANAINPLASGLLLSRHKAGKQEEILSAEDLSSCSLGRTRLVVLAACSTAVGGAPTREGLMSLARPFLAAGVPTVLGTLWDIRDGKAQRLLSYFHRDLASGSSPSLALQKAQIGALREPGSEPADWGGFAIIGSSL